MELMSSERTAGGGYRPFFGLDNNQGWHIFKIFATLIWRRKNILTQNLNNRLECKPLGNVLPAAKHLPELGSRELQSFQSLLLGLFSSDVALLLGVDKVERRDRGNTELRSMLLGEVLRVVWPVEVIAGDGALGTSHVASNDEVGAPEVLANHHVLDRLTGSSHVHGVREVVPPDPGVLSLLRQAHVGLVANGSGDVVCLGGSAGGVHKDNALRPNLRSIKRASEELVVSAMNGVPALEGNDVLVIGKVLPDLSWSPARELADGEVEALKTSTTIIRSTLSGNHQDSGMLKGGHSVALLALVHLVRPVTILDRKHSDVAVSLLQQHLLPWHKVLVVGVKDDREAEEKTTGQPHVVDHLLVGLLIHEPIQRRQTAVDDQLHVAQLTISELMLEVARS
mmetsp:Transcript_9961/g.22739  ORF Transcript_9961/g.22739 Transcript_9961/m.22739 type:complete len:396 (+) Transcript_9961:333-1520(+)